MHKKKKKKLALVQKWKTSVLSPPRPHEFFDTLKARKLRTPDWLRPALRVSHCQLPLPRGGKKSPSAVQSLYVS